MDAGGEALGRAEIVAGGRTLGLSRPDKVLFPATGFTKRDLVEYYLAVAPALLPHLAGRAVTLARFPDGVDVPGWYQANCPPGRPPWVGIAEVRGARGQVLRYCRLEEPAALAWAASMAAIELHPLLSELGREDAPSAMVLDLDPRPPAGLADCARVALRLREVLAARRLAGQPKASGGTGIHVHVPLDGAAGFAAVSAFARAVARLLADRDPARVTDRMPLSGNAGKVLVDWRQDSRGRSLIAPWSLRAGRVPIVAAPLRWEELEEVAASREEDPLRIGPAEAIARLRRDGDPFASLLAMRQRLPAP